MAVEPTSISFDSPDSAALLSEMLVNSPVGFARFDRDLRFVDINPSLATVYGVPVEACLNKHFSEIIGQEAFDRIAPDLRRVLKNGKRVEMTMSRTETKPAESTRRTETKPAESTQIDEGEPPRQMQLHWMPIRNAQREITGASVLAFDTSERTNAQLDETSVNSNSFLQLALDTSGMGLWQWGVSGEKSVWWSPSASELLGVPGDAPPSWDALLEVMDRTAVDELAGAIAAAAEEQHILEHEIRVVWPDRSVHWLLAKGQVKANSEGEKAMVGVLADITAHHTQQAESARKSIRQAKAGEQAVRMQRVTAALSQAVTVSDICEVLMTEGAAAIGAPRSIVTLLDQTGENIERVVWEGYDDVEGYIPAQELGANLPIPDAITTRQPVLLSGREEGFARYPEARERVEISGTRAIAVFPLIQDSRVLGAWGVAWLNERDLDEGELIIMMTLAAQGAQALERAQLYEKERRIANSLQQAVLPRGLPKIKDLATATRYRPGTHGIQVGGDWYDVIRLATNRVGLVIGDVTGHNIDAAGVMGQLRNTIRSYAWENHPAGRVLELTNRLLAGLEPGTFATCCYIDLNLDDGIATLATAGHPPPLVLDEEHGAYFMQLPPGTPLGTTTEQEYTQSTLFLTAGDTIVLYTDGLVESRSLGVLQGMEQLATTATANREADPEELADLLLSVNASELESDDLALLVVNFRPAKEGEGRPRVIHRYLPAAPASAGVARRFAADVMADWGALDLVDRVELCVSELVTNALMHTAAGVELILRLYPSSVRVEVLDHSDRMPILRPGGNEETSGRGLHIVEAVASSWGVDPAASGKSVWFQIDRHTT